MNLSFISMPINGKLSRCILQLLVDTLLVLFSFCSYLSVAVDLSKRSPELIQLLNMSVHFAVGTPGRQVSRCTH